MPGGRAGASAPRPFAPIPWSVLEVLVAWGWHATARGTRP